MTREQTGELFNRIIASLEAHTDAITELYSNQKAIYDALQRLSERNDQLIQAAMRYDTIEIQ